LGDLRDLLSDTLAALNAATGELLWRFKRPIPEDMLQLHPTSRGVGLWGDKVYFAATDAVLVALDAKTGKEVWSSKVEDYAKKTRPSNVSLDEMRAVWETNVFGVLAVYQAMLPLLRETKGARIVNVSSGVGSLSRNSDPAFPYRTIFGPVYPASKTALNALTLAMAIELEGAGIPVNAVSPGMVRTGMTEPVYRDPKLAAERDGLVPVGRVATPEDIADVIAFLLGPDARYVNGHDLVVDGGITAAYVTPEG